MITELRAEQERGTDAEQEATSETLPVHPDHVNKAYYIQLIYLGKKWAFLCNCSLVHNNFCIFSPVTFWINSNLSFHYKRRGKKREEDLPKVRHEESNRHE